MSTTTARPAIATLRTPPLFTVPMASVPIYPVRVFMTQPCHADEGGAAQRAERPSYPAPSRPARAPFRMLSVPGSSSDLLRRPELGAPRRGVRSDLRLR